MNTLQDIEENRIPFGDYFDWYSQWWEKRDSLGFLFVKYEDMKTDPVAMVTKMARFVCIHIVK